MQEGKEKAMKTMDAKEAARLVKEGAALTHKERMKLREERLHALVDHAREHSPYLSEKYKKLPEGYTLFDLPITEKAEMTEHYNDYVTDPEVRLSQVEAYVERSSLDGRLFLDKYTVLHTSGTTGKPLYMVRDDHRNKLHGQLIQQRLLKGSGPDIMDHTKHKLAAVIFAEHGSSSYESFLRQQASVPGYEDQMLAVHVLEDIETIVRKLNGFQPEIISGYGSVLMLLALEKQKGNLDIPVKMIANSAETLSRENHLFIENAFGCPVKNNYCMTEGGEIAMTQDGPDMLLNEDFVIIEPVDENKNPVADPGEWSQGILVTDLTNYVQPVIRYYVDDSVKVERIADDEARLPIFQIHGRSNALFELCGKPFSSAGIDALTELYPGILNYQFTQIADDELQVRALTANSADREKTLAGLRDELEHYFKAHGCPDAKISYSTELLIKKERGGKAPRYMDLRK